jgi:putative copper resistance protein D
MDILIHSIPLWVELISIAFYTGILTFFLFVLSDAENHDPQTQNRLWLPFFVSVAAAMVGSVIDLLLRVGEMSGETVISSFPMVPTVLFNTHSGRVWLIRIVCLVLMLVAGKIRKICDMRLVLIVLFCLAIITAFTESASGHAADKGDFSVAEIMDWIHLQGALVWAGGIFVLSFVIFPRGSDVSSQAAFRTLVRRVARFSGIAGIAVFFVVLTALYNALVYVGTVQALARTSYGLTIATKSALLFLLLLLAAHNRYVSVPSLGQLAGLDAAKIGFLSRLVKQVYSSFSLNKTGVDVLIFFKRAVRLEAFLLLGLLLCAALLRHEIPARHAMHGGHTGAPLHEHMRHLHDGQ